LSDIALTHASHVSRRMIAPTVCVEAYSLPLYISIQYISAYLKEGCKRLFSNPSFVEFSLAAIVVHEFSWSNTISECKHIRLLAPCRTFSIEQLERCVLIRLPQSLQRAGCTALKLAVHTAPVSHVSQCNFKHRRTDKMMQF